MKPIVLFIAISLLTGCSLSEERAVNDGELFKNLLLIANGGDAVAQFKLAQRFEYGNGVKPSLKEAVKWYVLAAQNGSGDACEKLGDLYWSGRGVILDHAKAYYWYSAAGRLGRSAEKWVIADRHLPEHIKRRVDFEVSLEYGPHITIKYEWPLSSRE